MELTQILIIVGVIGGVILLIVAIRGSFKSDDAFYGEAPPLPGKSPAPGDASGPGDGGKADIPSDSDVGNDAD